MGIGIGKIILILVIVLIIFGAGKLPQVMGDIGKGIKNLKEGMGGEAKPKAIASNKSRKKKS